MINNDIEYKISVKYLKDGLIRIKHSELNMKERGFKPEEIDRMLDPLRSFYLGIEYDIKYYEKEKEGKL